MNLKSGFPFWLIRSGLIFDYPKLSSNKKTDVVIIGGGISGALTAWELARHGIDCIIVDARTIGLGSTCASTSLLQYEIDVPLTELQHKTGIKNAVRAYKLGEKAIHDIASISEKIKFDEFINTQSLYYAAYKKDVAFIEKEYALRKKYGFDLDILSDVDIKKNYGFNAPAALLTHTAAETNAYKFTHSLLQHLKRKGTEIFDRTEIIKAKHRRRSVILKTKDGFTINAKKVIYAVGYEGVKYIDKPIVNLLSTYAIVSEHMNLEKSLWKNNILMWNTQDPYLYMRSTDNRIIVGGRDENFFDQSRRDKLIKRKTKLLEKDFKDLFPEVPFTAEFSWSGVFGSTKDGLPYIGKYQKFPNSYFALGFGGNGITFSQTAAQIICNDILGKQNKDAAIFSFER